MLVRAAGLLRRLYHLAADPERSISYYPNEPRKNTARRFRDLLWWYAKHREVNQYYYCWGMDRENGPRERDLLSYREFKRVRDARNARDRSSGLNYIALLRDKYLFSLLLEALNFPAPELLAVVRGEQVEVIRPRRTVSLDEFIQQPLAIDGFCKPQFGVQGHRAFRLRTEKGQAYVNDETQSAEQVAARASRHVLQSRVEQHPDMASLHTSSVNTMRVITVRDGLRPRVFSRPLVRVGSEGRVVDNAGSDGLQVFVNTETGRLTGSALRTRGGTLSHHPNTKIAFDGFVVPHFDRALELAVELHSQLLGLHSVGWDLAITTSGPVFIEGNDNWAAGLRMGMEPDFKREFEQLFLES